MENMNEMTITPELVKMLMGIGQKMMEEGYPHRINAFRELNLSVQKDAIVFAGDSITDSYPLYELFPRTVPVYNRGIGGITTKFLLENIEAQVLALSPKKLFLLIGTNDIGEGEKNEDIAERIKLICSQVTEIIANVEIYLLSVYPINKSVEKGFDRVTGVRNNETIIQLNELLIKIAAEMSSVTYIDVYSKLTDSSGDLCDELTTDGLHLSIQAYKKVTQLFLSYIEGSISE